MALSILLSVSLVSSVVFATSDNGGVRFRRVNLHDGTGIVDLAKLYVGTPYKYGGTDPKKGFDCSGYVQYVYSLAGYKIPHSADTIYQNLRPVDVPKKGDLVFFKLGSRRVSHVGIYTGNYRFLHAPQTGKRVSYADIRDKYWKQRYAGSRSIFAY